MFNLIKNKAKKLKKIVWIWWVTLSKKERVHYIVIGILSTLFLFSIILHIKEPKIKPPIPPPIKKKYPTIKKPLIVPPKRAAVKRTPVEPLSTDHINQARWGAGGFAHTLRRECGDCKKLCAEAKHDKGGLTCGGFAYRDNSDLFAKIIDAEFQKCRHRGIYTPPGSKDPFGMVKDTCYYMRLAYWDRYIKYFKGCSWEAICYLGDVSILQGPRTAIKLLQRANGLKRDGVLGPKTKAVCKKFDIELVNQTRIDVIKTYKDFQYFGNGWLYRIGKTYKFCKNKRRLG